MYRNEADVTRASSTATSSGPVARGVSMEVAPASSRPRTSLAANPPPVLFVGPLDSKCPESFGRGSLSLTRLSSHPPSETPQRASSTLSTASVRSGASHHRASFSALLSRPETEYSTQSADCAAPTICTVRPLHTSTSIVSAKVSSSAAAAGTGETFTAESCRDAAAHTERLAPNKRDAQRADSPSSQPDRLPAHEVTVAVPASEYEQFMVWKRSQQGESPHRTRALAVASDMQGPPTNEDGGAGGLGEHSSGVPSSYLHHSEGSGDSPATATTPALHAGSRVGTQGTQPLSRPEQTSSSGDALQLTGRAQSLKDSPHTFIDTGASRQIVYLVSVGNVDPVTLAQEPWARREMSNASHSPEVASNLTRSRMSGNTPLDLEPGVGMDRSTMLGASAVAGGSGGAHSRTETPRVDTCRSPEPLMHGRASPRSQPQLTAVSHTPLLDTASLSDGARSHRSRSDTLLLSHSGGSSFSSARVVPSFFRASLVAAMSEGHGELASALDQPMTAQTYSLHHTQDSYDSARSFGGGSHLGASASVTDAVGSSSGSSVFLPLAMRAVSNCHSRSASYDVGGSRGQADGTPTHADQSDRVRSAEHDDTQAPSGNHTDADVPEALRHLMSSSACVRSTKALPPVPADVSTANGLDLKELHRLHRRVSQHPAEHQTRVYHRLLVDEDTHERFHILNEKYVVYPLQIGRGSYARVKLAYSLADECFYALKIMDRRRLRRLQRGDAVQTQEASLLWSLRHRNIVALREVLNDPDMRHVLLVLELAEGGEVMSLHNDGRISPFEDGLTSFPETQSQIILYGIVNALMFAHKAGVAHRDVKPANVLLTAEGEVKLSDFGASVLIEEERLMRVLRQGSVAFLAPELLLAPEVVAAPRSFASSTRTSTFATSRAFTTMSGRGSVQEESTSTPTTTMMSSVPHDETTDDAARAPGDLTSILLKSQSPATARTSTASAAASSSAARSDAVLHTPSDVAPSLAGTGAGANQSGVMPTPNSPQRMGSCSGNTSTTAAPGPIGKPPLNASRRGQLGGQLPWGSLSGTTSARNQTCSRSQSGSFSWQPSHPSFCSRSTAGGMLGTHDLLSAHGACDDRVPFDATNPEWMADDEHGGLGSAISGMMGGTGGAPLVDLFKADVFSLGVTAFALLMGRLPWLAGDATHQFAAIRESPDPFLSAYQDAYGPQYESPPSYQGSFHCAHTPSSHAIAQPIRRGTRGSSSASLSSGVPSTPSAHLLSTTLSTPLAAAMHAQPGSLDLPPQVPLTTRQRTIGTLSDVCGHGSASRGTQPSLTGVSSDGTKSTSFPGQFAHSGSDRINAVAPPSLSTLNSTVSNSMWMDDIELPRSAMPEEFHPDRRGSAQQPQQWPPQAQQQSLQPQQDSTQRSGLPVSRSQPPAEAARLPFVPPTASGTTDPRTFTSTTMDAVNGPHARSVRGSTALSAPSTPTERLESAIDTRHRSITVFSSSPSLGSPKAGSKTHAPEELQAIARAEVGSEGHLSEKSGTGSLSPSPQSPRAVHTPGVSEKMHNAARAQTTGYCDSHSSVNSVEGVLRDLLSSHSSLASFEADEAERVVLLDGVRRRPYAVEETLDLPADSTHGVISAIAVDFVRACLHPDPLQRRSIFELFDHPWMQQVLENARRRRTSDVAATADGYEDDEDDAVPSEQLDASLPSSSAFGRGSRSRSETASDDEHNVAPYWRQPSAPLVAPSPLTAPRTEKDGADTHMTGDAAISSDGAGDGRLVQRLCAPLADSCLVFDGGEDQRTMGLGDGGVPTLTEHLLHYNVVASRSTSIASSDATLSRQRVDWQSSVTADQETEGPARAASPSLHESLTTGAHLHSSLISPLTAGSLGASLNPDFIASLNNTLRNSLTSHGYAPPSSSVPRFRRCHSVPAAVTAHPDQTTSPVTVSSSSLAATGSYQNNNFMPNNSRSRVDLTPTRSGVRASSDENIRDTPTSATLSCSQATSSGLHAATEVDLEEHGSRHILSVTPTTAGTGTGTGAEESVSGAAVPSLSLSSASDRQTMDSAQRPLCHTWLRLSSRPVSAALRRFLDYTDAECDDSAAPSEATHAPTLSSLPLHPAPASHSVEE